VVKLKWLTTVRKITSLLRPTYYFIAIFARNKPSKWQYLRYQQWLPHSAARYTKATKASEYMIYGVLSCSH